METVAHALDYPSASAFRNTCRRYLAATPLEVRAHGGAACVVERLLASRGAGNVAERPAG